PRRRRISDRSLEQVGSARSRAAVDWPSRVQDAEPPRNSMRSRARTAPRSPAEPERAVSLLNLQCRQIGAFPNPLADQNGPGEDARTWIPSEFANEIVDRKSTRLNSSHVS